VSDTIINQTKSTITMTLYYYYQTRKKRKKEGLLPNTATSSAIIQALT